MELTQAQRDVLLDRAVEAVRTRHAVGPDTDPGEVARRVEVASMAVTDAVTRGGMLHTQIAGLAGVPGLRVIGLITDWSAQGVALGRERHAAARYVDQVRDACASHSRQRVSAQGYGAKSQIAREIGVNRPVVDGWIKQRQESI
jgi:DNA-binding transcriptional regulator YdaS (Cro superfamily)